MGEIFEHFKDFVARFCNGGGGVVDDQVPIISAVIEGENRLHPFSFVFVVKATIRLPLQTLLDAGPKDGLLDGNQAGQNVDVNSFELLNLGGNELI